MIRMVQSESAAQAKIYFTDGLLKADYYYDDQEVGGEFRGKLAARLGIAGAVTKDTFFALCDNKHPLTGGPLTPRTRRDRTTGYDVVFDCPKSVSILHFLSKDNHILDAFQQSVYETMDDIEREIAVRVRKKGQIADRKTGEVVYADFTHLTARPVEGHDPDPQLHMHCYMFNVSYDEAELTYKAGKFRAVKKNMPYYQALFTKRFSDRLMELGYSVQPTKTAFEVEGVPEKVIELFSKRKKLIHKVAKEKGITDAKALGELGAKTRAKKQKGRTISELKESWRGQIMALYDGPDSRAGVAKVRVKELKMPVRFAPRQPETNKAGVQQCIEYALKHHFERASVVSKNMLLATAYQQSIGVRDASADTLANALNQESRLITMTENDEAQCTTKEVLREEKRMVELAKRGIGAVRPLYSKAPVLTLEGQQKDAAEHVLTTPDRISIVRGAAGAGKTTLMREIVSLIEAADTQVTVLAPTGLAARDVLRKEGFTNAETLALFLDSPKMQAAAKGRAILLDEAGLTGTQDMLQVIEFADANDARLILCGDTRQHASVKRGDALRILNTIGGIKAAEVSKIYRQRSEYYREAVKSISDGNIKTGFDKLDELGFIRETDKSSGIDALVADYMSAIKRGKTGLVISPTHNQGEAVTRSIREKMLEEGMIGQKSVKVTKLRSYNLTEAEKSDWRNYKAGDVVHFNQHAVGFQNGSRWKVHELVGEKVMVADERGQIVALPVGKGKRFDVFAVQEIDLAKGDKVRMTRTNFDRENHRLNNGQVFEVAAIKDDGIIRLVNSVSKQRYEIDANIGHIDHAHCITSYSAQGKTVDEVFISQPATTFGATNAKQFYVSVSRGRDRATIYTDDKEALLNKVAELGDRTSALELIGRKTHLEHMDHHERTKEIEKIPEPEKTPEVSYLEKDLERYWDYEPGI